MNMSAKRPEKAKTIVVLIGLVIRASLIFSKQDALSGTDSPCRTLVP